jgi:uncharacterized membrane protein
VRSLQQRPAGGGSGHRSAISISLAAIVIVAVTIVSFLPGADKHVLHTSGRLHSWGHLIVFSVVGYVANRTSHSFWLRVLVFMGSVIFGLGIEVGEHLVFHAGVEWKDVLVDALGVVAGTLFALAISQTRIDE